MNYETTELANFKARRYRRSLECCSIEIGRHENLMEPDRDNMAHVVKPPPNT